MTRLRIPALLPVMLAAAGCGDESAGPGIPADFDAIDAIVYTQHVQPVLDASCALSGCHTGTDPTAGLRLDDYESLSLGSDFGSVVVPGHPERSHLYLHVAGEVAPAMPFEREPLREDVVRFLGRWIEEGARADDGAAMYSGVLRKAFVACQGDNLVAVLDMDPATRARARLVHLLEIDAPHSVYVDAPSRRLYVSRFETASDNLHVYDADTYELLGTGRAGTFPALMAITPDGSQLWVTNFDAGANPDHRIRVLDPDPASLQEIVSFSIPGVEQPHGLAISGDGSLVYVANIRSSNVTVFRRDPTTGAPSVLHPAIPLPGGGGQQPQQCVLSADETRLFVSALGTDQVHVLDVAGVEQPGWTATWNSVAVGAGPWHLALAPSGNELWVANWLGESITVLDVTDPDHAGVVATLQPAHPRRADHAALQRPMGIAFSPDGTLVYVTSTNDDNRGTGHHPAPEGQKNPGSVAVFDAATRELVAVAEVPNFARFVSFLP